MIDPCSDDQFRAIVAHLRAVCPPPHGTSLEVRRVAGLDDHGTCEKHRRRFRIEIRAEMSYYETTHTLIHEWAHMLSWRPYHPLSGDHGSDWGVWYSRVWRKYYGTE